MPRYTRYQPSRPDWVIIAGIVLAVYLTLVIPLRPVSAMTVEANEKLAVIGVRMGNIKLRKPDKQRLQEGRVGFGITQLLAEALYASQQFQLVDEKDRVKQELIEDLVQTYWIKHDSAYPKPALHHLTTQLGTSLLAYGTLVKLKSTRNSVSVGLFSKNTQKLKVRVEVCLYHALSRDRLCRKGRGEAKQTGTGIVYTFRDDNQLDFEKNASGLATKQAIVQAVGKLIDDIHFSP